MQFYFLFLLPSSLFCCYQNLFSGPMSFASHFIFVPFFSAGSSAAGQQRGSKDINWPICMFQWASERKWHLQSFLFLGRERIIALHCFKAYQVTSKAFQHPFLAAGWWRRRCSLALSLALLTLSFKFMKPLSWPHEQLLIFVLCSPCFC